MIYPMLKDLNDLNLIVRADTEYITVDPIHDRMVLLADPLKRYGDALSQS